MANSYPERGRASPHNSQVYDSFLGALTLQPEDHNHLAARGLTGEHIQRARYATKRPNKNNATLAAVNHVNGHYDLNGVPGFALTERGHRTCNGIAGIMIPVRDLEGHIHALLCRSANPPKSGGLTINKYIFFSSAGKPEGAKVQARIHCPVVKGLPKEVCGTHAMITEGVLKADVATALGERYCFGNSGLGFSGDFEAVMEEAEISTLDIAYDMGEDDNDDYVIKVASNILRVQELGIDLNLLRWDPALGKGIDDVIKAGHWDKVSHATQEEIDALLAKANRVSPRGSDWKYCIATQTFFNTKTWRELNKSQYSDKFNLDGIPAVNELLMNNYPKVDDVTYLPKGELVIENAKGELLLNIWEDPCIEPIEGDIQKFHDHIAYIFPDEIQRNIMLSWMAYNVQHPEDKVLWAVLIVGRKEGTGKSILGFILRRLLGDSNVSIPENEQLSEQYTGWLKRASLTIIEEVYQRDKFEIMNKIKPMITQDTISIREMRKDPYPIENFTNFLMYTNHDGAITIKDEDRRYCVLKTQADKKPHEYYKDLWDWVKLPETASYLMHYFMNYDLSKFDPKDQAPMTEPKKELLKLSRSGLEEWIAEGIEDEVWPFNGDIVSIRHLKNREVCPNGYEKWSNQKWAEAMKDCGAEQLDCYPKLSDGSRTRLWVIRRHDMWRDQAASKTPEGVNAIRKHYESASLDTEPGYNPVKDAKPI